MNFLISFNTQPPEGGWSICSDGKTLIPDVSTHSRLKAAGPSSKTATTVIGFQHTAA